MKKWWRQLPSLKQNNNLPAKGTVSGALVVLENLKNNYTLNIDHHRTKGRSQIKGAGGARTRKILARHGETRTFSSEAGRTNRGLAGGIEKLLEALRRARLEDFPKDERSQVLEEAQIFLVGKVREYFSRERVKLAYNSENTTWQTIHDVLEKAKESGKEGPVAQYLVGAKLSLRFPEVEIRNDSYSTSDIQSGSPGDFSVNDTVFHVTVSPNLGHLEKCKQNVEMGYRTYILVPDRILVGTRQNAESMLPGRIAVQSIESFVAQNVEELSIFSKGKLVGGFRLLLEKYNERVNKVEPDKSMLIELPRNL